ncbi:ABC transporter substrate-binding protein, partial [Staphylococcus aureus]
DTAITEFVGSGPFRFVTAEYQPGVKAVYEKFTDYAPRNEPASWLAGGKVVKVDRVEWLSMPDAQTAINAIQSGEIDYIEAPPVDLLPLV